MKAPNVRKTIIDAFERGIVLTHGKANELTQSSEGGRTIRRLRLEGYPIEERMRPNKLRAGKDVKEFFYSEETLKEIREARKREEEDKEA